MALLSGYAAVAIRTSACSGRGSSRRCYPPFGRLGKGQDVGYRALCCYKLAESTTSLLSSSAMPNTSVRSVPPQCLLDGLFHPLGQQSCVRRHARDNASSSMAKAQPHVLSGFVSQDNWRRRAATARRMTRHSCPAVQKSLPFKSVRDLGVPRYPSCDDPLTAGRPGSSAVQPTHGD
jgi:hypothetical protein